MGASFRLYGKCYLSVLYYVSTREMTIIVATVLASYYKYGVITYIVKLLQVYSYNCYIS